MRGCRGSGEGRVGERWGWLQRVTTPEVTEMSHHHVAVLVAMLHYGHPWAAPGRGPWDPLHIRSYNYT